MFAKPLFLVRSGHVDEVLTAISGEAQTKILFLEFDADVTERLGVVFFANDTETPAAKLL